jgi:hypothetical protein
LSVASMTTSLNPVEFTPANGPSKQAIWQGFEILDVGFIIKSG